MRLYQDTSSMFTSGYYVVWCVEGRLAVPSKKRQEGKKRVERSRRVGGERS